MNLGDPPKFNSLSATAEQYERALFTDNCIGEVPRERRPSADLFRRRYLEPNLPVVLTDALDDWPALVQKWTLESIGARLSHRDIRVFSIAKDTYEDENGKAVFSTIAGDDTAAGYYVPNASIVVTDQSPAFNHQATMCARELAPDVPTLPWIAEGVLREVNLWAGTDGITTNLHFDPAHNLMILFRGRKEGILFPPSESRYLYPIRVGEKFFHLMSHVDVMAPRLDKMPLFRRARYHRFTLEAGEVLFIPWCYWHFVRSHDTTLAINYWFGGPVTWATMSSFRTGWSTIHSLARPAAAQIRRLRARLPVGLRRA